MPRWYHVRERTLASGPAADCPNQDAFRVKPLGSSRVRAAISDGASNSHASGAWAQRIVDDWVEDSDGGWRKGKRGETMARLGGEWAEKEMPLPGAPWYEIARARRGSHATFLGADLRRINGVWLGHLAALGDSCAFLVRDAEVRSPFPIKAADAFGSMPDLLPSAVRGSVPSLRYSLVNAMAGDVMLLATDALAAWVLERGSKDRDAMRSLLDATERQERFRRWVLKRRAREMEDDDVTAIVISIR